MPPIAEQKDAHSYAQTFEQILLQRDLSEQRYAIDMAFWQSVWTIMQDEEMAAGDKLALLRTTIAQMSEALLAWAQQFLLAMASGSEIMATSAQFALETKATALLFDFSTITAAERKVGAVLSARNKTLLETVIVQLQALLASATPAESASADRHALDAKDLPAPATADAPASGASHADANAESAGEEAAMLQNLLATLSVGG